MAERTEKVRVLEGNAVNIGTRQKPDTKFAGESFDCPKDKVQALVKQGVVEIVITKEEIQNGG